MKVILTVGLLVLALSAIGQTSTEKLILKGDFTEYDQKQMSEAYLLAGKAVAMMQTAMDSIWCVDPKVDRSKMAQRIESWENNPAFVEWLGEPEHVRAVRRKIKRINRKFKKRFVLEAVKENQGKCRGWIGAWTLPWGPVKIRLCDAFFAYRTHLQEKIIIHEVGHEAGMLFHRRIHICWAARRAAGSERSKIAKKSPENYAWLAVSFIGMECY